MPTKLKPCPFCGGEVEISYHHAVLCKGCDYIWQADIYRFQEIWNTRHEDTKRLPSPLTVTDVGTNAQPIVLISVGDEDREIYFEEGDTQESINARIKAAVDEMSKGCEVTVTFDDTDTDNPEPLF